MKTIWEMFLEEQGMQLTKKTLQELDLLTKNAGRFISQILCYQLTLKLLLEIWWGLSMSSFLPGERLKISISIVRSAMPMLSIGIDILQNSQERQWWIKYWLKEQLNQLALNGEWRTHLISLKQWELNKRHSSNKWRILKEDKLLLCNKMILIRIWVYKKDLKWIWAL